MMSFIDDIRIRNGRDQKMIDELESHLNGGISEILERLNEEEDKMIDEKTMIDQFTVDCRSAADQLRQRATLMRQRADEMDRQADSIEGPVLENTVKVIQTASQGLRDIDEMLRQHNHINPTKV